MAHSPLLLFFIILFFTTVVKSQEAPNFVWTNELELDKDFTLKWTTESKSVITMEMSAETNGYVAIGFSPNGGMKGSDIVMGWVDGNGTGFLQDLHATGNQKPLVDPVQNYQLLQFSQTENRTTIVFRRKWNTCDELDFDIGDDTVRIIWAYHENDPETNGGFKPSYHGEFRGIRRAFLRVPETHSGFPAKDNEQDSHWDIKMENNNVTGEDNVFFCAITKFEDGGIKRHMTGFKPIIDEGQKYNIHHMILYECVVPASDGVTKEIFEKHLENKGGKCYTPAMPPEWSKYCNSMPILWTAGSEGHTFPAGVGYPLGEEHGGSTYFMFEIHYDNPKHKTFLDSSGLRLFHTSILRPNEGGVLSIGQKVSPFHTVPHEMSSFTSFGYCTSECTGQTIPPEGINVITVLLHSHYQGRKVRLVHLRNGKELKPLAQDNNYDYNYQQARVLEPSRKVLPGDELLSICEYDTAGRDTPAFGGLGTRDEMCMSFVTYYPRMKLVDCRSQIEFNSYLIGLGIGKVGGEILNELQLPYSPKENQILDYPDNPFYLKNSTYENPLVALDALNILDGKGPYGTVGEMIRKMNWKEDGGPVEEKWNSGKHYTFCTGAKGTRFPLKDYIVSLPKYEKFVEKNMCQG